METCKMNLSYTISKWPNCGVGNKLLYYWNLRQSANRDGYRADSVPSPDIDSLIRIGYIKTQEFRKQIPFKFCLGENFFDEEIYPDRIPIDEIFKPQGTDTYTSDTICIHLRGGDFKFWKNGEGLLSFEYYKNAIDYVLDAYKDKGYYQLPFFTIVTDDVSHPCHNNIEDYLDKNLCRVLCRRNIDMVRDWYTMVGAEWIISSPSTFAITAGMISNAKIIHSKKWVENRVRDNDPFWVGINNGGNHEYKAEVLL